MTLTPEEIKQIEQEANEMFPPINSNHPAAMQNEFNNSQLRNVWIEVSTKYLLQLKEERERAGKLLVIAGKFIALAKFYFKNASEWPEITEAENLITEYKNNNQ